MTQSFPTLPEKPQSVWRANTGAPSFAPLVRDRRGEVVVVGAGIAGLTTALVLARAGHDVVVLDAHAVGDGVTGVSTAKATLLQSTRYSMIERTHGPDVARRYAEAQRAGQDQMVRWMEEFAPAARLHRTRAVTATTDPNRAEAIAREAEAASRAGLDVRLHGSGEDLGLPFDLAAAVSLPDQVDLDPVPYLWAMAGEVERAGGVVHERTRVTGLLGLDGRGVVTEHGDVEADHIVVTTGMPIFDRAAWFARAFPTRSYVIAAALADGVTVPMDSYYGIDTPNWSLRPAWDPSDERILLCAAGGHHVPGREAHPIAEQKRLAAFVDNRFEVREIRYRWSAQDYRVADKLPAWGPMWSLPTRVLVATGFDRWGFTNGTAAGIALAARIDGEQPDWSAPFDSRRFHPLAAARPFLSANAGVGYRLVRDWLTGGPSRAPETGPGTPAAQARAGDLDAGAPDAPDAGAAGLDQAGEDGAGGFGGPRTSGDWSDAPVAEDPRRVAPPPVDALFEDTTPAEGADRAAAQGGELSSDPRGLADGQGVVIRRGFERVGVAKVDGELRAVRAVCSHLGGVLAWNDAECSWDCPLHGSRFDSEGRMLQGPACRDLVPRQP